MDNTTTAHAGVGDPLPPGCQVIEVHVGELNQLFNAMDPAPFRERDLDPNAEAFIVEWARELHHDRPLALVVHLDRQAGTEDAAAILKDAVREFFKQRALATQRKLRQLFKVGRRSLVIGLVVVAASVLVGDLLASALQSTRFGGVVRESLLIGGWVAMWRPLEIFLYDWWPIRAEAGLYDRLSSMPVRIEPAPSKR
ncbi:MAG: hypothetical protein Q7R30_06595 [Acidobacteriota bacterium]|nr:hypothetical protein [Acidobacteriota bacterium]